MIRADEKIFNLDEPTYDSYNRKKEDYIKISPTTGTANNLNQGGNVISFEVNNQANYLMLPEAFLYSECHISNKDGSAVPGNITLEHNWFPRAFDEIRLEVGSQQVEIINEPGEFDTIIKFISRGRDYAQANNEGWIPDTGTGNSVEELQPVANDADTAALRTAIQRLTKRVNLHNLNTGYLKRKEIYNNANGVNNRNGFWIKWPLSPLLGYLDHKKISVNLPFKLNLKRISNDEGIFFGAKDQNARLEFTKLELWIPSIQPSLSIETKTLNRLKTDNDIKVSFFKRNTFTTTITPQEYSWPVASISNTPRFLFAVFKPLNLQKAFDVNNSLFTSYAAAGDGVENAVQITDLQVRLNQTRYPLDPIIQNPENTDSFQAYDYYEKVCKMFGIEHAQLDPVDFRKLYPIYCFDLSAQDENLVRNGVNIHLWIKKTNAEPLTGYCLILEDTSHLIKVLDGRMVRVE